MIDYDDSETREAIDRVCNSDATRAQYRAFLQDVLADAESRLAALDEDDRRDGVA